MLGARKRRVALAERDEHAPDQVRQAHRGGGPNQVERGRWRDPNDTAPTAARTAREVAGYRRYCPLARMARQQGSSVTMDMVHAANLVRLQADVGRIGYSPIRDGLPVTSVAHGPRAGPSRAAVAQARAAKDFSRAMKLFRTDAQRRMIDGVILNAYSLQLWCRLEGERRNRWLNPDIEMGRLLTILEMLVEHYSTEIARGVAAGKILPVT